MKKKDLEMILQSIPSPITTKPQLEQYITPASIASDIIFFAHLHNDILNKKIIDLGCGTGIFAIGTALTGAKHIIAIEIDPSLLKIAQKFAHSKKLIIQFINDDIKNLNITSDTVITNPPFGAQKPNKHADRLFLEKAYECAPIIYSIHQTNTLPFITKLITALNGMITHKNKYIFPIKHQFSFHQKPVKYFDVTLVRSEHKK